MPELYFSHTEQPVNKKSGGTKMMNRLFKRGMVIALAAAMTTSAGIPAMAAQKETLDAVSYTHLDVYKRQTTKHSNYVNCCRSF